MADKKCIYETDDDNCKLMSEGWDYVERCVKGPCNQAEYEEVNHGEINFRK